MNVRLSSFVFDNSRSVCSSDDPRAWLRRMVLVAAATLTFAPLSIAAEWRTVDGSDNNVINTQWGSVGVPLTRIGTADYPDDGSGATILVDSDRANPREISNTVSAHQPGSLMNDRGLSSGLWQWGQFLDHDIDLTGTIENCTDMSCTADIPLEPGDILGPNPIHFTRSNYAAGTGTAGNPRQQINEVTSYIDGSNVYGSNATRAAALRTMSGGEMKTSAGNLLPLNTPMLPNAGGDDPNMFLAGDVRANEQVGLTAMHTLFVREHNRLADLLATQNPALDDEQIYQTARRIVGAELQCITYTEFLPMLLGPAAPQPTDYSYDANVDPTIRNEFSTALYRFGHSMLTPELMLADTSGAATETLALRDAFFDPAFLQADPARVDKVLMGLAMQQAEEIDLQIVDDVRDFLFGSPGAGGMDLGALNIQRGRDHGVVDYNTLRDAYGLAPLSDFSSVTSDTALASELQALYGDVNNIDAWVGALAEDHVDGTSVGPLLLSGMVEQFERLRDGDRFFYTNDPVLQSADVLAVVDLSMLTLSQIVQWNTVMSEMPPSYFQVPEPASLLMLIAGLCFLRLRRSPR